MDILTADFDWISLLLVLGAGVFGLIKSSNDQKKKRRTSLPPYMPQFETEEEEETEDENYTLSDPVKDARYTDIFVNEVVVPKTDYCQEKTPEFEKEPEQVEEKEEIYTPHFDIRQAVISSEILKRPEY